MSDVQEREDQPQTSPESDGSGGDRPPTAIGSALMFLKRPVYLGLVIFLFAFLFRLIGIGWGLPDERHHWSYHPDEPVIWEYSQQIKPAAGKFTPGFYNYGTLYLTLLNISTDVVGGYSGAKADDLESEYKAMAVYHLAGRVINALAGAAMAWVVLLILWRRTHWLGALFGALAVALAPGLVIHSRFQTVDVLATFLLVLGIHYALKLDRSGVTGDDSGSLEQSHMHDELKYAILSGVFFGLSAGTKYTGLLGLIVLAVVCIYWHRWKELAVGVVGCLVAFALATPGMFLDSAKFWKDFQYEMAHTSEGHGLVFAGTSSGFLYHLGNLAIGFGVILSVLGVIGLGRSVAKKHAWAIALALFALAYFTLIGRAEVKFLRYTFPLIPVLAIGAGWIVGRAHIHPKRQWKAVGAAGLLGLGGLFGGGAATAVQATGTMASPNLDPREATAKYLHDMDRTAKIGIVSDPWFYTPNFYPEAGSPRWLDFDIRDIEMKRGSNLHVLRYVPENPEARQDWDVRLFDLHPDIIVFSSFETEGIDRLAQMTTVPPEFATQVSQYKDFMARLQKDFVLDRGDLWNPWRAVHDLMYIRPTIWVWKNKTFIPKPPSFFLKPSVSKDPPAGTQ